MILIMSTLARRFSFAFLRGYKKAAKLVVVPQGTRADLLTERFGRAGKVMKTFVEPQEGQRDIALRRRPSIEPETSVTAIQLYNIQLSRCSRRGSTICSSVA